MINSDLNYKAILIVKYRALGDSIIGLGAISYLKKIFPKVVVIYAVPDWIAPLYRNVESSADQIWPISLTGMNDWFRSFRQFALLNAKVRIDFIYEFHQSGRSGYFFKLISLLFRKKYFFHNHNHSSLNRASTIQRDLDGIEALGNDWPKANYLDFTPKLVLKKSISAQTTQVKSHKLKAKRIIFGMSATRSSKQWPIEYYKELVDKLLKLNPQLTFQVPLSNSTRDQEFESRLKGIEEIKENVITLLKVPLSELPIELMRTPSIYVGSDSGIKHLCVALGFPTFTIFGPEEPYEWHPYSVEEHPFFYLEQLPCRTSASHFCGKNECENLRCMRMISSDQVFKKIIESNTLELYQKFPLKS